MNTREIRELFSRFFEERGHRRLPSSSLIPPPEERTMLFTTAGMVQMKPYFMGLAPPPATRMTTVQKCFRTSDVEEVGDNRHCTFFEMLGNFSVGDYFKPEVIPWAWELLTSPTSGLGLKPERIWATIFTDDEEAHDIWRSVGLPEERIRRYGEKENYWFMGGVGPCGPNTEIYYDFGDTIGCRDNCHPNCDNLLDDGTPCDRFIELWNLVFMTLFQDEDGSRRPLPQRNVDTGAGLERWSMPLLWEAGIDWQGNPKQWQRPPTIYDTDVFRPILAKIGELAGVSYNAADEQQQRAMRVVAEHARAATFLIADGVTPANDGRGYVLRRLIRRAVYHGWAAFGTNPTYLPEVATEVIKESEKSYSELAVLESSIRLTLVQEVGRFTETMSRGVETVRGLKTFANNIANRLQVLQDDDQRNTWAKNEWPLHDLIAPGVSESLKGSFLKQYGYEISLKPWLASPEDLSKAISRNAAIESEAAFILWDTLGLPPDVTKAIAQQEGLGFDMSAFEEFMDAQRARSRAGAHFEGDATRVQTYVELGLEPTEFVGYETTRALVLVSAIVLDGTTVVRTLTPAMSESHRIEVVLDHTPFYAEGGGQVGDRGEIVWPDGRYLVEDTQTVGDGRVVAHLGRLVAGSLSLGDPVEARVDESLRADTMRNHTATHILHAALRQVVGQHVRQAGSLVTPDRLRFDFTHQEALTPEQLQRVESLANEVVRSNIPVHVEQQSYEEALKSGALAFFGDKYAATVRVVGVCDPDADHCFSRELCGGTHVHSSGDVGTVIVTSETSIGAGLRRIEAVSGRAAAERVRHQEDLLGRLSAAMVVPPAELETRLSALREENDRLRKQLQATERRLARQEAEASLSGSVGISGSIDLKVIPGGVEEIGGVKTVIRRVDAPSVEFLRDLSDGYKQSLGSAVILLASVIDGKPAFLAMATPDVAKRCPAGDVVRAAAQAAGGSGGGRPEVAQGGGTDASKVDAALAAGRRLIEEKLGAP